MVDLDELEALANAATPGPWWVESEELLEGFDGDVARCEHYRDTAFIAAANPKAVLAIIAELRRLRGG